METLVQFPPIFYGAKFYDNAVFSTFFDIHSSVTTKIEKSGQIQSHFTNPNHQQEWVHKNYTYKADSKTLQQRGTEKWP
jgi:hypothetical protein